LWYTSVISALERLKQEDCGFKPRLGYIVRPCLKTLKSKTERERKRKKEREYLRLVGILKNSYGKTSIIIFWEGTKLED
jgi:hypothetical protein